MTTAAASPDDLLSTKEACAYLGVSRPTLLALVRKHRCPRVEIGERKATTRNGRRDCDGGAGRRVLKVPALVKYRRRALDAMVEKASRPMR